MGVVCCHIFFHGSVTYKLVEALLSHQVKFPTTLHFREYPNVEVYFDEVKAALCDPPSDPPCSRQEYDDELARLEGLEKEGTVDDYEAWKNSKVILKSSLD